MDLFQGNTPCTAFVPIKEILTHTTPRKQVPFGGELLKAVPFPVKIKLRLGKYFGLPAKFWLNLQNDYDLRLAKRRSAVTKPRTAFTRTAASSAG